MRYLDVLVGNKLPKNVHENCLDKKRVLEIIRKIDCNLISSEGKKELIRELEL